MPDAILLEIATDGPGFLVDEAPARLGQILALPPWLEPERETLERELVPDPSERTREERVAPPSIAMRCRGLEPPRPTPWGTRPSTLRVYHIPATSAWSRILLAAVLSSGGGA